MSGAADVDSGLLAHMPLPSVSSDDDKEARGRVLVVAGSTEVPGAVVLAGTAALRAGAGKLQLAAPASLARPLGFAVPEARVFGLEETGDGECAPDAARRLKGQIQRCDALVIGPGMIDETTAGALTAALLAEAEGPAFVIDAAAMTGLRDRARLTRRHSGRIVITPHAGEMAALTGLARAEVEADPLAAARGVAARLQTVTALKGAQTLVVSPEGQAWRFSDGVPGLATSGSGDVLAGIIAGLLARGAAPVAAAIWGVWLHGRAGARLAQRIGPVGFLAREIADEVPGLMAEAPRPQLRVSGR